MENSPQPGDLYVLDLSSFGMLKRLDVEWLVLEREPGGKLLLMAADTRPLAGSADLQLPEEHPLGPLVIRCGITLRLPARLFSEELRTGRLDAAWLAAVEERRLGNANVSATARAVDHEAEHRLWIRELAAACDGLERSASRA